MFDPFEKSTKKFLFWSLFFMLMIFMTFLFFHPKFYTDDRLQNLNYENISDDDIYRIVTEKLRPGDIILDEPVSYGSRYVYQQQFENIQNNKIIFFIYYNTFEFMIDSMGDGNYWHSFIYMGNNKMNSLAIKAVEEEMLSKHFTDNYYFIVLRPNVSDKSKDDAVNMANTNFDNQGIIYSFKNGLLIVFSRATGVTINPNIRENELVCSSYAASLYPELNFNGKDYRHVTPIDLFDEKITEIVLAKTRRGFYYEK